MRQHCCDLCFAHFSLITSLNFSTLHSCFILIDFPLFFLRLPSCRARPASISYRRRPTAKPALLHPSFTRRRLATGVHRSDSLSLTMDAILLDSRATGRSEGGTVTSAETQRRAATLRFFLTDACRRRLQPQTAAHVAALLPSGRVGPRRFILAPRDSGLHALDFFLPSDA